MRAIAAIFAFGALGGLASISCGGGALCDSADLTAALSSSLPGDEVRIGDCAVSGVFTVPADVTLSGNGRARSRVVGGLVLNPGPSGTTASQLAIQTDGGFAVLARGAGRAAVEEALIIVARGVGLGFEDLDGVVLRELAVEGPVEAGNAGSFPADAAPADFATHGIALVRIGAAELTNVDVSGFAQLGAIAADSTLTWTGGTLSENLGVSIAVESGSATLTSLAVRDTLSGFRLLPAFGGVFASASIETTSLTVERSEGFGVLHFGGGTATHSALSASANQDAALWAESLAALHVSGTISDNDFAGIVAVDVAEVLIESAAIDRTRAVTRIFHPNLALRAGDGLHLVRSATAAVMRDLTLTGNERAGVFIELDGGALDDMRFSNVAVTVTSTAQVAVLAQGGVLDANWDQGVTRNGTDRAADLAKGPLLRVEGTGPCDRPRETGLGAVGLALLGAP